MLEITRLERWSKYLFYLCLFILVMMILALAARVMFQLSPRGVFQVYVAGAGIGLCLSALGLLALALALRNKSKALLRYGLLSILHGALPALAAVIIVGPASLRAPLIHDLTTDTQAPPEFIAAKRLRAPGDNNLNYGGMETAAQQGDAFPDLQPIITELAPEAAYRRCLLIIDALGWTLTGSDSRSGHIEAYEASALFGFIDDVVIRIMADGENTRIDIRSASRVGTGDLGANARRIRGFIEQFEGM